MLQTIKNLLQYYVPNSIELHFLALKNIRFKKFKKGEYFLRVDEICDEIFYLHSGFVRGFVLDQNKNKLTCWFKWEKEFVTSVASYSLGVPSKIGIEFIEDSTIFYLAKESIEKWISKDIYGANFYRKNIEKNFDRLEEMLVSHISKTATERYIELMEKTPMIIQRAPLSYVASYLGITQSSLSRLRAKY